MRIVVTGAGGGLGRALLEVAPGHHDLVPLSHADLDIGDHAAVMGLVPALRPDAIVNAAALADVDACESDPEGTFRANAVGPQSLALAARACDAALLHVSTDYVFDGTKGAPYDEADEPRPLPSVYARSKLLGERLVRDVVREHLIVRTSWIFGGGKDRLTKAIAQLRRGEATGGLSDRIGSPTDVRALAARLIPLLLTHRWGTYHLAGPEATTWFDLIGRAKDIGGLPGAVTPQLAEELALRAPRPTASALLSVLLPTMPVEPMPPLDASVADLLARTA